MSRVIAVHGSTSATHHARPHDTVASGWPSRGSSWWQSAVVQSPVLLIAVVTLLYMGAIEWSAVRAAASVDSSSISLRFDRGTLLHDGLPFDGAVMEHYANGHPKRRTPYRAGVREGAVVGWHENGVVAEERTYERGLEQGTHRGWYPDHAKRFEYRYRRGHAEGVQSEWYASGQPYTRFEYRDGQESGRQRMWTEQGTLRANYVVEHGRRFGLMGTTGCSGMSADSASRGVSTTSASKSPAQ